MRGDVAGFACSGAAGEEFNAFLQARTGSADTYLQLDVVAAGDTRLGGVASSGTDTSLLRQVTGRFALPTTGTYRLRVSGSRDRTDPDRGPYRLLLYKVNPRPETAPDTIALGDSVSRESIDVPGDVDEGRVSVPDSSDVNLVVQRGPDGPEGVLTAQLLDANGRTVASAYSFGPGFGVGGLDQTGRLALAPGTYTVRVDGSSLLTGTYRLWLYAFKFGPESVRDTFAIGDTVAGESIDPLGDIDRFRFYATHGQHINIAFQALGGPLAASLWSPKIRGGARVARHGWESRRGREPARPPIHARGPDGDRLVHAAGRGGELTETGPHRARALSLHGRASRDVAGARTRRPRPGRLRHWRGNRRTRRLGRVHAPRGGRTGPQHRVPDAWLARLSLAHCARSRDRRHVGVGRGTVV